MYTVFGKNPSKPAEKQFDRQHQQSEGTDDSEQNSYGYGNKEESICQDGVVRKISAEHFIKPLFKNGSVVLSRQRMLFGLGRETADMRVGLLI